MKQSLLVVCLWLASGVIADGYDRKDFNYRSYKPNTSIGFYTNKTCDFVNIDHIVSLKDAYESGAASWSASKKKAFANDGANHVPSCGRVNSSKGSEGPSDFLRRSRDGRGVVKNDTAAVKWYTKAAEQGNKAAQNNLGFMYAKGKGVTANNVKAHMWWNLAILNGSADAENKKESISKSMTAEQIAKAQDLSEQCLANSYKDC